MSQPSSSPPADRRPAGNQFSLRGLFILMTAVSLILALLALAIRQTHHWLGALCVLVFCLLVIGALEGLRRLFPPKPRLIYYLPPPPPNPLPALNLSDGNSPFGSPPGAGESPFAPRPSPVSDEMPPDPEA